MQTQYDSRRNNSDVEDLNGFRNGRSSGGKKIAGKLGISKEQAFDYKNPQFLKSFLTERGRILPRRLTGLDAKQQRALTRAIKRSRQLALLPYVGNSE
ncbi:MAG: 30S ribosomal protein S18 [Myxococcales bacterium]|nr:MAG: 30S ribosomal protein S18 [Myxococcales bacterium]